MKKILSFILAIFCCLSITLMLAGCENNENSSSSGQQDDSSSAIEQHIPVGYKLFQSTKTTITFAVPQSWTIEEVDGIFLIYDALSGNNIVLTNELKIKELEDLNNDNFIENYASHIQGVSITGYNVEKKNNGAHDIFVANYLASLNGATIKQVAFITHTMHFTYILTVTTDRVDVMLLNSIYRTIRIG